MPLPGLGGEKEEEEKKENSVYSEREEFVFSVYFFRQHYLRQQLSERAHKSDFIEN